MLSPKLSDCLEMRRYEAGLSTVRENEQEERM
jgi:hypothetical protein